MNLPSLLYAVRWLVWDTLRQATSTGLFYVMLAVTVLCTVFCLSISVTGGEGRLDPRDPDVTLPQKEIDKLPEGVAKRSPARTPAEGELGIGFGLFNVDLQRGREGYVVFIQQLMAGFVADTAGLLLALVWTAGFLPTFLEPQAAAVLLAKPAPRWVLLLGKFLGVILFVFIQAALFVGLTWAALGVRTGVWDGRYLLTVPLLLTHFTAFFGFSVFLAVCTRSTVASIIGSVFFWLMCFGLNFGRHAFVLNQGLADTAAATGFLVDVGYWALPKPADLGVILFDVLKAGDGGSFSGVVDQQKLAQLREQGDYSPPASIVTSLAFGLVMLGLSVLQFRKTDY